MTTRWSYVIISINERNAQTGTQDSPPLDGDEAYSYKLRQTWGMPFLLRHIVKGTLVMVAAVTHVHTANAIPRIT